MIPNEGCILVTGDPEPTFTVETEVAPNVTSGATALKPSVGVKFLPEPVPGAAIEFPAAGTDVVAFAELTCTDPAWL